MSNTSIEEELDLEWVELILEALEIGLSVNEIKHFLNHDQMK